MELSTQDFTLFRDMLYERTGLMFDDKKLAFLRSRIERRAIATSSLSSRMYYQLLKFQDPDGKEFQKLVEQVTTNETYFFREFPQLECFANEALPRAMEKKRAAGDYTLNIWCACCSTGDEAYTLAIILHACLDDFPKWKVRLWATDIDTIALQTGQSAVYGSRNVKEVPEVYLQEYFLPSRDGEYRVAEVIRKMVEFEPFNLMDKSRMRMLKNFDFIFCRNALIYFDDSSRKQVLGHFYNALVPGGFVFLGHSESVGRITSAFEATSLAGTVAYRKPLPVLASAGGFQ